MVVWAWLSAACGASDPFQTAVSAFCSGVQTCPMYGVLGNGTPPAFTCCTNALMAALVVILGSWPAARLDGISPVLAHIVAWFDAFVKNFMKSMARAGFLAFFVSMNALPPTNGSTGVLVELTAGSVAKPRLSLPMA